MPVSGTIVNIEALSVCAVLVILLFCFNLRNWKPDYINSMSLIYICTFLICVLEIIAYSVDGDPKLIWINKISNALYLTGIDVILFCWLYYCNKVFPRPIFKTKLGRTLFYAPGVIVTLLILSSPWTGIIFGVTEEGYYYRADLFLFQYIPYIYLIISSVLGAVWYRKAQTTKDRSRYLTITLFVIPTLTLGLVQVLLPPGSLTTMEFSILISLLAYYVIEQDNRVTRDELTGLNNRRFMDAVLLEKVKFHRHEELSGKNLYVMMGDLDGFKEINDRLGHLEGDRALVKTADVLTKIAVKYDAIVSRFGGDEFTVIIETASDTLPAQIDREIQENLKAASEGEKFQLCMSFGYSKYNPGDTIITMLSRADDLLYEKKRKKRAQR